MGSCCAKGDEGRRIHVQKITRQTEHREAHRRNTMKAGTLVKAEWDGAVHDAVLCVDRGAVVDVTWEDGTYSHDIPATKIQQVEGFKVGDRVQARWQSKWLPAVVVGARHGGSQYDVEWSGDRSITQNLHRSELRHADTNKKFHHHPSLRRKHRHTECPTADDKPRLHGLLEICIKQARSLPDADYNVLACSGTPGDPYCELYDCRGRVVTKTQVIDNNSNPRWEHHCKAARVCDTDVLHFAIKDEDVGGNEIICECVLTGCNGLTIVESGHTFAGWMPLQTLRGKPAGEIFIWLRLLPQEPPISPWGLVGASFPMRAHNRVTLYQSAHVGAWAQTLAPLPGGYTRENCWEDMCRRIVEAKRFVYIMGWSVNTSTRLLRERPLKIPGRAEIPVSMTLGQLLKEKANEGVKVCVLLWSEKTSLSGTGSGQTKEYFKGTRVACKAVFRESSKGLITNWTMTHHQKGIMVDVAPEATISPDHVDPSFDDQQSYISEEPAPPAATPSASSKTGRRVVAFVGGLDVTGGRWDTPAKELFSTLAKEHKDDYYQVMFEGDETEGPRQPWQDIHCQIEGPTAHDVVANFENRWLTQADMPRALYHVAEARDILTQTEDVQRGPGAYDVQMFRSIDRHSDKTVPGIEADCHLAWVRSIERAQRFIYIENQYFMGGCDKWDGGNTQATPSNRIPDLIVRRIVEAIKKNEAFVAYIVIPLFPEGDPESRVMQEILYWQNKTISAMYAQISAAIRHETHTKSATDYLNFYTLGQRKPGESTPKEPLSSADMSRRGQILRNCRMPIYVHSKMLIVDDEYMIVGSCNINDRSMAGDRDTEIAVGLHQPDRGDKGDVRAFRLSLWSEHLGIYKCNLPHCLFRPEKPACLNMVNKSSTDAWRAHADDYPTPQLCHLMKYPYAIGANGKVTAVQKYLPDTKRGKVLGAESSLIPDFLTS